VGLNVGVGVLEFGRLDHGVFVVEESGRQVADHVVHDDCVVTRVSVRDVGLERSDGFDLVELVLGEHGIFIGIQVHVFQVTVVKVFHG